MQFSDENINLNYFLTKTQTENATTENATESLSFDAYKEAIKENHMQFSDEDTDLNYFSTKTENVSESLSSDE